MGLLKFLSRMGAVGGTARIIAKQFNNYRKLHPDRVEMTNQVVFRLIIMDRFSTLKNKKKEEVLKEKAWEISGLKELVIEILTIEAGFLENSIENQLMFEEIIEEELLKMGISSADL